MSTGNKKNDALDFISNPYFGDISSDMTDVGNSSIDDEEEEQGEAIEEHVLERVEKIAENTVQELSDDFLPPLPMNYQIYFERLLEKEDAILKQKIQSLMNLQSLSQDRVILFEKSVKEGLASIKRILELVSELYRDLHKTHNISEKYAKELAGIDNKLVFNNTIKFFLKDLDGIKNKSGSQIDELKEIYQRAVHIVNDINENTIYDSKFEVYNKRYFFSLIDKERELIEEMKYDTTVLTLTLTKNIINSIKDKALILVLLKSIAKLLLKTSRRSDILAYLGNGIFAMGLKYSDITSAKKAAERLIDTAKQTNVFSDGKDIQLTLAVGIAKVRPQKSVENIIQCSLTALKSALEENVSFKVYAQDEAAE